MVDYLIFNNENFPTMLSRIAYAIDRVGAKTVAFDMEVEVSTVYRWRREEGALDSVEKIKELGLVCKTASNWILIGTGTPDLEILPLPKEYRAVVNYVESMPQAMRDHYLNYVFERNEKAA